MAKNTRHPTKKGPEFNPLDELYTTLVKRIDRVPEGQGKSTAVKWGVVAAILIATSSVLFAFGWLGTWVPAIIGAPAGVILFVIGLGLVRRTRLGEWNIFEMRETYSFKQRMKRVLIWFVVYAVLFVPIGRYVPYGLGGAVLIILLLTALAVARRTPQELEWAKHGLPDPRDLAASDDDDDYAEEPEAEAGDGAAEEADKIYYDEQRGGFGGKLK